MIVTKSTKPTPSSLSLENRRTGWNGVTGSAVGGPMVDPATGETIAAADADYPACSATVTDNCLQTYERGRSDS